MAVVAWSTQQLAEFVAAVSAAESEAAAALMAVERVAEAFDADVAAIIAAGELVAGIGYPEGTAPVAELGAVNPGAEAVTLEVPGVGACMAAAATLEHPVGATLVVARAASLTREETGLLRGMARVASITMRLLRVLAGERAAREEREELAREQAALRRVATLVAEAASPNALFASVAEEAGRVVPGADLAVVGRYEPDGAVELVGAWSRGSVPSLGGSRLEFGECNMATLVFERNEAARVDYFGDGRDPAAALARLGVRSAAGAPINVEGLRWGVMTVASLSPEGLPAGVEHELAAFTELVAIAIANAEAREERRAIADEQAALRRVATLVAQGAPPPEVFAAVTAEVGRLLGADITALVRYLPDDAMTQVAVWSLSGDRLPAFERVSLGGEDVATLVHTTGRPARLEAYPENGGEVATAVIASGGRSAVGAPISVDRRLWGLFIVVSRGDPPALGTEYRLANFTELVATAIANAEAQAKLTASRARIVATADETRRRIERDLHDGAQQRLVSLTLQLRAAQQAVPPDLDELAAELDRVAVGLTGALDELRELARGIHPAILAERGLAPALKALARRSPVPVRLNVGGGERLPEPVEVGAYYVVSEALANVAKHSEASAVAVDVEAVDGVLRVSVRDDGVGGAEFAHGSGLAGLRDRVEALGGRISLESPGGAGTSVEVELPLTAAAATA